MTVEVVPGPNKHSILCPRCGDPVDNCYSSWCDEDDDHYDTEICWSCEQNEEDDEPSG